MRLFVAVDPDEALRARIAERLPGLRALAPDAKWTRPEGLHLTLAFLGEVAEARVPALGASLAAVAARGKALHLQARGAGTFGSGRKPRVLWIDLLGEREGLIRLAAEVAQALEPLGFVPDERPFSPHLTLARARQPRGDAALARCAEALGAEAWGDFVAGELILYRSELSRQGARYTALQRLPLGSTT